MIPTRQTQLLAVSMQIAGDLGRSSEWTFQFPFVPKLNPDVGEACYFQWFSLRLEPRGLALIVAGYETEVRLSAIRTATLLEKIFETAGIKASPSSSGLVVARLISQMGGPQGCRVFKIRGVRRLVEQFSPASAFHRGQALQVIQNREDRSKRAQFDEHATDLYIEGRRRGDKLVPASAFDLLVRKGLFRAGFELRCPTCHLMFWASLDDVQSILPCEYCGVEFNVAALMRPRDLKFRRSGLFGRSDHQEGGIPVALVLQQLSTTLSLDSMLYSTGTSLLPLTAAIEPCETDFVVLSRGQDDRVKLVIGESKTSREIEDDDVRRLMKVAASLPNEVFDVFLLFAKTDSFSAAEVERCACAQGDRAPRVILLSRQEVEPYFVYQHASDQAGVNAMPTSLEQLAEATTKLYPALSVHRK